LVLGGRALANSRRTSLRLLSALLLAAEPVHGSALRF
jgi:hypothetical protein